LYRDVNINQGRGLQAYLEIEDSHVTLTPVKPDGQQESSSVSSQFVTSMLNLILDADNFSEFRQTNQFAEAVSAIPGIVHQYMNQQMNEAPGGSGTNEGNGSKPGVPDVPADESKEELSWNSSDGEGADDQEKIDDDDEGDEDQEVAKNDDKDDTKESGDDDEEGSIDEEDDNEEIRDEESFDPIPQTPKSSEDEGNGEEDQGLNISEEERHNEEKEEDVLYRDVNINQGRGLQAYLEIEDSHVTLTPVKPDGQQESSSVSSQF
nr:hypothetical protein [Tanacetum cinerariifolium]